MKLALGILKNYLNYLPQMGNTCCFIQLYINYLLQSIFQGSGGRAGPGQTGTIQTGDRACTHISNFCFVSERNYEYRKPRKSVKEIKHNEIVHGE